VYLAGSQPLHQDRQMLTSYTGRGLRVRGVRLTIDRLRVEDTVVGLVRLILVDQLGAATAVTRSGRERRLPRDRPSRHAIVLRRTGHGWRIASISG
jgi:hypothetical protein